VIETFLYILEIFLYILNFSIIKYCIDGIFVYFYVMRSKAYNVPFILFYFHSKTDDIIILHLIKPLFDLK